MHPWVGLSLPAFPSTFPVETIGSFPKLPSESVQPCTVRMARPVVPVRRPNGHGLAQAKAWRERPKRPPNPRALQEGVLEVGAQFIIGSDVRLDGSKRRNGLERRGRFHGIGAVLHAFRHAEAAVSPVISTILMVAITVVLAATAFVLVADVGGTVGEPAPNIGLTHDDETDQIRVTTADVKANWDRIALQIKPRGAASPILVGNGAVVNDPAGTGGLLITGRVDIVQGSLPMAGGDFLQFCRDGATDGPAVISFVDIVTNTLMGTYEFAGFEACS